VGWSVQQGEDGGDEQEFEQPVPGVDGGGDGWDSFPQDGPSEQDGGEGEPEHRGEDEAGGQVLQP